MAKWWILYCIALIEYYLLSCIYDMVLETLT